MFLTRVVPILFIVLILVPVAHARDRQIVGWVENVTLHPGEVQVKAKVDTGAKTSSLHCECIDTLTIRGKKWISFAVISTDGKVIRIKKPVLRIAKIRRHFGDTQHRYVVNLGICLGSVYREEEVTLVDRSGFNYPMLIGRNFLRRDFLVDPNVTFATSPACEQAP